MKRSQFILAMTAMLTGAARAQAPGPSAAGAAAAAEFPKKPIRFIVPFGAGGGTDVLARSIGKEMSDIWKQSVVVENRAGGGGVVGTTALAQAPGDGYTIGIIISSHAVNPGLHTTLPYDSANDFTPLTSIQRFPLALAVHPSHPAKNFKEFMDYVRANPGKQVFGSAGTGTASHLAGEMINIEANVNMPHAPYRGGAAALADLLAGHITMSIHIPGIIMPHVKQGKLRVIAVTTAKRVPYWPDVQAVSEILPGFDVVEWYALAGPKNMPPEIAQKISREIARELELPSMKARFPSSEGVELSASTPEQFDAFLRAELKRWPPLVRKLGLKAE